jgi:3',5'-cyclic AMP phosphodiesterase CpdA
MPASLYREFLGETNYSFDHRGVHFIALGNVSRAKPEVGPEQIAWLKKDLARFPKSAPIVVLRHRPLFDLSRSGSGSRATAMTRPSTR